MIICDHLRKSVDQNLELLKRMALVFPNDSNFLTAEYAEYAEKDEKHSAYFALSAVNKKELEPRKIRKDTKMVGLSFRVFRGFIKTTRSRARTVLEGNRQAAPGS